VSVQLDHVLIPSRHRAEAAKLIATLFDVEWVEQGPFGPFSLVYLNSGLTLDFDQWHSPSELPVMHYCFRVDDTTFDNTLARIVAAGIPYRSTPHGPVDSAVNSAFGGRLIYWSEPDNHVWEMLTVSYERNQNH
jgi:hypothetical protein